MIERTAAIISFAGALILVASAQGTGQHPLAAVNSVVPGAIHPRLQLSVWLTAGAQEAAASRRRS